MLVYQTSTLGRARRDLENGDWSVPVIFGPGGQPAILPSFVSGQETLAGTMEGAAASSSGSNALVLEIPLDPNDSPTRDAPESSAIQTSAPSPTAGVHIASNSLLASQLTSSMPIASQPATKSTLTIEPSSSTALPLAELSTSLLSSSLVPSTTDLQTDSSTTFTTSTASPNPQTTAASQDPRKYVGIALGSIFAIAFIAALAAWFLRLRSHQRRRALRANISWSPDGDDGATGGLPHAAKHGAPTEKALEDNDDAISIWDRAKDAGEPKRSDSFLKTLSIISPIRRSANSPFADPPAKRYFSEGQPGSSYVSPVQMYAQANPFLTPTLGQLASESPASVPVIRVHSAQADDAHLITSPAHSVTSPAPMGTHTFGSLRVTNMMPGDRMSSGSESSPRLFRQAHSPMITGSEFGTPREPIGRTMPRFMTLRGGGLEMPRAEQPSGASNLLRNDVTPDYLELPLPAFIISGSSPMAQTPAQLEAQVPSAEVVPGTASWAASIRSNLASALAAVAERTTFRAPASADEKDALTPLPVRVGSIRRQRLRDIEWQAGEEDSEGATELSRTSTVLEPNSASDGPKKPGKALIMPQTRASFLHAAQSSLSRASSVYSTASASGDEDAHGGCGDSTPKPTDKPPRLPSFVPLSLSRGLSSVSMESSGDEHHREGAASALELIREKHAGRRPRLAVRTSWSGSEQGSVGTADGSEGAERLTDDEKRAQRMLMERRKVNMGAGVGRGKLHLGGKKSVKRAGSGRGKKSP